MLKKPTSLLHLIFVEVHGCLSSALLQGQHCWTRDSLPGDEVLPTRHSRLHHHQHPQVSGGQSGALGV